MNPTSWWLNQPSWNICVSQNGFIFPKYNFRGENKKYLSCHHLAKSCLENRSIGFAPPREIWRLQLNPSATPWGLLGFSQLGSETQMIAYIWHMYHQFGYVASNWLYPCYLSIIFIQPFLGPTSLLAPQHLFQLLLMVQKSQGQPPGMCHKTRRK